MSLPAAGYPLVLLRRQLGPPKIEGDLDLRLVTIDCFRSVVDGDAAAASGALGSFGPLVLAW
jgi:hypothetical protein